MGLELDTDAKRDPNEALAKQLWTAYAVPSSTWEMLPEMIRADWLVVARVARETIQNEPAAVAERMFSFWRSQKNDLRRTLQTRSGAPLRPVPAWDEIPPKSRDMWIRLAEKVIANDFLA